VAYCGEGVGGVGDEHAGLADGAVPDRDALYEPGGAHPPPPSAVARACPLLVVPPPPAPTTPLVGLDGENKNKKRDGKCLLRERKKGRRERRGAEIGRRGQMEGGAAGGGERVAEEAVSAPERWFLPPGNEPSQAKPSQEMEDGWRAGEAVGWVETKRGAHGVRAHHFPLYDSCIISIPINPNLIPLLLRRNVMMAQTVRGRHGPESSLLPQ
jgi:hypothetical protein